MTYEQDVVREIYEHVRSGNSALWVVTREPEELARRLETFCSNRRWPLGHWDAADGLVTRETSLEQRQVVRLQGSAANPALPVSHWRGKKEEDFPQILLLLNYHKVLDHLPTAQLLANAALDGKSTLKHYVVLAPTAEMPPELRYQFTVIDHRPPSRHEVGLVATEVIEGQPDFFKDDSVDALLGLTRRDCEQSLSWAYQRYRDRRSEFDHDRNYKLLVEDLWARKAEEFRQRAYLELLRGHEGFESLGGLEGLKTFTRGLLRPDAPPAKGIILTGVPGSGKSQFCKCLGAEVGRPVIRADMAACYDKHVGESEANIRDLIHTAEAQGRCILMLDELDKALSGVGGEGDSGVATRVFGTVLTWLQDREDRGVDVFAVATSNDLSRLPPEFSRAGRFDGVFFVDTPGRGEKDLIWAMYLNKYGLSETSGNVDDADWTGGEIKHCCYLSSRLGINLAQASRMVVPVATRNPERLKAMRDDACGKYLCARTGRVYTPSLQEEGLEFDRSSVRRRLLRPDGGESR